MKTIVFFKKRETYGNRFHFAKVVYDVTMGHYLVIYKYTSMTSEQIYSYQDLNMAMYNFHRVIMFLLA